MRKRLALGALVLLVALGAWGVLAFTGGASTPVYDREATRACVLDAGFQVRWHGGSAETGLPGLELGPAARPLAELRFAPSAKEARNATVKGEDTVYDNVIVFGDIRDSQVIRSCLREA